jgi:UDP-glucose 4-epimerase
LNKDNITILITGAYGLLGSAMVNWILRNKENYNLILIDDLSGGYLENINLYNKNESVKVESFFIDLNNTEVINKIFKDKKIDYVYHFAAYAAEGLSPFIRSFNYTNNLLASINIINNCIKYNIKRLVFTSSMAVYGRNITPYSEDQIPNPIDPYGIAKYAVEMDIQVAGEQHNLDWCIIRPHNVFGEGQNIWDKYRNVLGIWMYKSINDLPITIYGDGQQKRAFSYIDNILLPLWYSMFDEKASKQIINLGGTNEITILEAAQLTSKLTGNNNIEFLEQRHEIKEAYPTYQKSIDILNYKEDINFESGLEYMWLWVTSQPTRTQKTWNSYEIDKGIYSFWKI